MLIEAKHVTKNFGDFCAVNQVSLNVHNGECLGLLGPNGAGKSTFISMLYGASLRTSGELKVFGDDPAIDFRKIKKRMGVVTQDDALDESTSVFENMMMFAGIYGLEKNSRAPRVKELLQFMSLDHKAKAPIRALSGGMRRRLVFVRALLNNPDFIILDEPTTGLDPAVRILLWEKIQELKLRKKTILLTTHYMDEAEILCDRIVIMNNGQVIAQDTPKNLIAHYCPGFVAVIKKTNVSSDFITKLSAEFKFIENNSWYQIRGPHLTDLGQLLEKSNIIPDFIRPANLEDAFLAITGKDLSDDA